MTISEAIQTIEAGIITIKPGHVCCNLSEGDANLIIEALQQLERENRTVNLLAEGMAASLLGPKKEEVTG